MSKDCAGLIVSFLAWVASSLLRGGFKAISHQLDHDLAQGQNVLVCCACLLVLMLFFRSLASCVMHFSAVVLLSVTGFAFLASPFA